MGEASTNDGWQISRGPVDAKESVGTTRILLRLDFTSEVAALERMDELTGAWAGHDPLPILQALVATPTFGEYLGVEDQSVRWLAQLFDGLGVPYVVREEQGKAYNIRAEVGGEGPSIVLNSHLDVVPPGDLQKWLTPPFEPQLVDGKVYGRGTCDAKGSAAAMVAAFLRLYDQRHSLQGRVILSLVGAEEIGGLGVVREIEMGLSASAAIVGEPTQLTPHVGHKGRMVIEVTTRGKPAHSSNPDAGVNAISKMARLIPLFDALHNEVQRKSHPLLGTASSAVTRIQGGVAVNVVPGECTIQMDRRLLPGETPEQALEAYHAIVEQAKANDPELVAEVTLLQAKEPAETEGTQLPSLMTAVAQEVLGRPVQIAGFPATCDMTHLVNDGGIPTVIFGPGDLGLAHQYNEYLPVNELYLAAEVYYRACLKWTNSGELG